MFPEMAVTDRAVKRNIGPQCLAIANTFENASGLSDWRCRSPGGTSKPRSASTSQPGCGSGPSKPTSSHRANLVAATEGCTTEYSRGDREEPRDLLQVTSAFPKSDVVTDNGNQASLLQSLTSAHLWSHLPHGDTSWRVWVRCRRVSRDHYRNIQEMGTLSRICLPSIGWPTKSPRLAFRLAAS